MTLRRILLALLLAVLAVGISAPSAYAGGPTSVLMVNPDRGETRAAYHTDSVYAALADAVGEGQAGPDVPAAGVATGGGEEVRLTWLIHDVEIWRIDRIFTTADGIWIETAVDMTGGSQMSGRPAHWHRPADEAALTAVLSEVGLLGDGAAAPADLPEPAAQAATATPVPVIAAGLSGLVLGAAGALVAVQARRRTPAEQPERVTLSG
jgi:hypothetical protein